jgi:hypothetical protein
MADKENGDPPHDGYRIGGRTRGGRHADREGKAGGSRTAKPGQSKRVGRPPGQHRRDDDDQETERRGGHWYFRERR